MQGGSLHEHMIEVMKEKSEKRQFQTDLQVPSKKGKKTGYIDLLIFDGLRFLMVEAELRKTRVLNDIQKQKDFGKNAILWIVCPTKKLVTEIKSHLKEHGIEESETLYILVFSEAVKRLSNKMSSFFSP